MSSFLGFCEWNTRNKWRDGQVCPDVDKELWRLGPDGSGVFRRWTSVSRCGQGTMAPWARRLGRREGPGKKKKRGGDPKGEVEEKSSEKTRAGRLRKRRGESQSFLLGDADQESETRMSKNALRTGRRQAVEVPAKCLPSVFFPEKDEEYVSSVSTCNVKRQLRLDLVLYLFKQDGVSFKANKKVLLEVAIDLGVEVHSTLTKSEIKNRICQSKYYDEESVKCLLEGILEEEREKQEIKEYEERRLARAQNRTTEVSESVNKCRPVNNPVVDKSVENPTSCDFEKENCDPPVRCTNVSHPSEVALWRWVHSG
ncbi:hypothetical protein TNCV_3052081 [Trichonephila clavipes]|nr:hypothetical protein TNCV_3052081 [Trichonephila clavipes]